MAKIVSLSKRRGFVFPSSEIYGGVGSTWDYGPLGVALKRSVKEAWWRAMVLERDDIVGLDSAIIQSPQVWVASGHAAGFVDPLVDCKVCRGRFRPDHVKVYKVVGRGGEELGLVSAVGNALGEVTKEIVERGKAQAKSRGKEFGSLQEAGVATDYPAALIPCPNCGAAPGSLTEPRMFNLMFKTFVGPVEDTASQVWLRPETAQGIFINFDNVLTTTRMKPPFGVAQIGKSFRNEITPGNFIFRTREFEQMEMEYFVKPGDDEKWHDYWVRERHDWFLSLGINKDKIRVRPHEKSELAHYSKATSDIEYLFPWGWGELEGIANRADFDLKQHAKHSGKKLEYFDQEMKERYVPYVIEPALGADRAALAFWLDAYDEEPARAMGAASEGQAPGASDEARVVLRFHPDIAPVQVAVLPLSRNEKLTPTAREVHASLRKRFVTQYDDAQSIGRRYRRQDEIGTPLCVTIDFDTVENDNAVTIRNRDSMRQVRVPIAELPAAVAAQLREMGSTRA
ncbi:MAG: glycine--tRNA ligase [SAR202 cluster bacterium]|nr:glycine--tRNA ligase [SAR202 cluster bacterium]